MEVLMADKKKLAEQVVAALIAANSNKLNSEERALQRKAADKKDASKKESVISFYAGRFYKEDQLKQLLVKFNGMK
jgi:hypothetical protein